MIQILRILMKFMGFFFPVLQTELVLKKYNILQIIMYWLKWLVTSACVPFCLYLIYCLFLLYYELVRTVTISVWYGVHTAGFLPFLSLQCYHHDHVYKEVLGEQ